MTSPSPKPPAGPSTSITELAAGDHIQAWTATALYCSGTVELLDPDLGVLWLREDRIGARRLLDTEEHQIHHHPAPPSPLL
ncbi:hypothetical protein [Kocuria sp. SM24M-10]|uniref:hypothetical protein n=1 Tax=Kocuria sp. SM24M-10 TaxID=1660349 RepID=UPI000A40A74D|nr:hypothetical protein [Kocuria sp. SM24M-10]